MLRAEPFDACAELSAFAEREGAGMGAMASFIGFCRSEGGAVLGLELEHYPGFTEREIERLCDAVRGEAKLSALLVLHRIGSIAPGEAIVLVAAIGAHRAEAFRAVERLMDYLKTDAPFWKREIRVDGARWVEPTETDRARRAKHECTS